MVGTIDVRVQAAKPNFPLDKIRAFLNSPSSLRLRNVPREIGKWEITEVFVSANYPDNSKVSVKAVETAGIYVATLPASTVAGESVNGYTVTANGIDENGATVEGYILGKGDLEIIDADGTITVGETTYYIHIVSTKPDNPRIGDLALDTKELWTGAEWISFKASSGTGATVLTMSGGKLYNGENEITQFSALLSLVRAGGVVLLGDVAGKAALFYPLFCDANAVRFDATGTLGNGIQSKSYAMTPKTGGGINISPSGLTELAKKQYVDGNFATKQEVAKKVEINPTGGEYFPVAKTFFDEARDNQATIYSFTIPHRLIKRISFVSGLVVRGASSDQGIWDRLVKLRWSLGHEYIETNEATMPIGGSATFGVEGQFNFYGDTTFEFVKPDGTQASVRIALVSVPVDAGFTVVLSNGTVSHQYAPIFTINGLANREVSIDDASARMAKFDATKELAASASQAQIISKINELIKIMKG